MSSIGTSSPVTSDHGLVVLATTTFQPTKPITLKEVLEQLNLHKVPGINDSQSSRNSQSDIERGCTNLAGYAQTLQTDLDPADQAHLKVMQSLENAKLASVDIVGPEKFGIVIGEGEMRHTFKKSGDILLINNHAVKEILKISRDQLIPGRRKNRISFSNLIPEIRQLILVAAARNEAPREITIEEHFRRVNPQDSAYYHHVYATTGFNLVCISKAILDDLLSSGAVQKIQLNTGGGVYFNRIHDSLRVQSCAPQSSTRLSLKSCMNFGYLKAIDIGVNTALAQIRYGLAQSLKAMIALETIIISGEVFTNFGPADVNELIEVKLDFNLVFVASHQSGHEMKMMPVWTRADGHIFEDHDVLRELEVELHSDFQGNPAKMHRMNDFLRQLARLFAWVAESFDFAPRCNLIKVAIMF